MSRDLKNKVIVITGGASGIGFEIAKNFLEKEAKITIILDIDEENGKESEKILTVKYGPNKAVFIKCDVTIDLDKVFNKIINNYGSVDVFVNNAGILIETDIKKLININTIASIEWALKFWEHMRIDNGGKGGTIMNTSSLFGVEPSWYLPIYSATKLAITGFSKALGHESNFKKSDVRVLALCPGPTKTAAIGVAWCYNEDLVENVIKEYPWQEVDVVGKAAVEVFEMAASGTAWLINDSKPVVEVRMCHVFF